MDRKMSSFTANKELVPLFDEHLRQREIESERKTTKVLHRSMEITFYWVVKSRYVDPLSLIKMSLPLL